MKYYSPEWDADDYVGTDDASQAGAYTRQLISSTKPPWSMSRFLSISQFVTSYDACIY